jgi:hypothetical protein
MLAVGCAGFCVIIRLKFKLAVTLVGATSLKYMYFFIQDIAVGCNSRY